MTLRIAARVMRIMCASTTSVSAGGRQRDRLHLLEEGHAVIDGRDAGKIWNFTAKK